MEKDFKCKICQTETKDQKQLMFHIKKFHPEINSYEDYILKYFFNGNRPLCECGCGKEMKFFSYHSEFFNKFLTNHFPRKPHTEEAKERIKVNSKKAMMDKYGVDNPMKRQESIDKIAETKLERYNDSTWNNPEQIKQTNLQRHGVEFPQQNAQIKEKQRQTNFDRYGARMFLHTPEGQIKSLQTRLENPEFPGVINVEKIKETKLKRHGHECEFSNPEWRRKHNGKTSKIEITVREKLGAEPKFDFMRKEYDMKLGNYIIEVDGDFYHHSKLENMNLYYQLNNSINDYIKTQNLKDTEFDLVRIQVSTLHANKQELNLDFVLRNRYFQDFSFNFDQILISKEELINYSTKRGKEKLQKKVQTMFRFLKVFEPEYIHLIPENILTSWRKESKIKKSISKCFGLFENDPCNVSLENLLKNLEI